MIHDHISESLAEAERLIFAKGKDEGRREVWGIVRKYFEEKKKDIPMELLRKMYAMGCGK